MKEVIRNYWNFFQDQAFEQQREYRNVRFTLMQQLFREEKACYATIEYINIETGHIIIRCKKGYAPRLKMRRSFVLIKKAAREKWGEFPPLWNCCFNDFIASKEYCTPYSEITPLYYLNKNDSEFDYLGCGSISIDMFNKIKNALTDGIQPRIIMFDSEPPIDYYLNLSTYLTAHADDKELFLEPKISYEEWEPEELAYDPNNGLGIAEKIINTVKDEHLVVVQGPPGTGKSYTIAHVITKYLDEGKSVCVTAMANKGLEELIMQPPLKKYLENGKLSKTMLTADEMMRAKGLKAASKDLIVPKGEALFATNYKLSSLFAEERKGNLPSYDLVVIEEASQAYLATIVAFKKLGNDILIVGDPMQLPPIVMNSQKSCYKTWNVNTQINGLISFALGTNCHSFRITTTFRLTESSAKLTGLFYGNSLKSVRTEYVEFPKLRRDLFPSKGGVKYKVLEGATNGISSKQALSTINEILNLLNENYPKTSIAIISPFKDTVRSLQSKFQTDKQKLDLTIETIDRVQGITVDYAILYCPLRNIGFALDERRFNVATSRSRSTTLILSDIDLLSMNSITGKVRKFLSLAEII